MKRVFIIVMLGFSLGVWAGCSRTTGDALGARTQSSGGIITGSITVFAASSLTETFTALGKQFEREHPGAQVRFSFGPSSQLAIQVSQGAPADVIALASPTPMRQAVTSGGVAVGSPQVFARNKLQVVVPADNPGQISTVNDLARPGVTVALCQQQVPCGVLAAHVLSQTQVNARVVTQEADVKAVLSKVQLGEVDAGLVYVSDVRAAGPRVRGVDIPAEANAGTDYLIAPVIASTQDRTAEAFVNLVRSAAGQTVLTAAGFDPPQASTPNRS